MEHPLRKTPIMPTHLSRLYRFGAAVLIGVAVVFSAVGCSRHTKSKPDELTVRKGGEAESKRQPSTTSAGVEPSATKDTARVRDEEGRPKHSPTDAWQVVALDDDDVALSEVNGEFADDSTPDEESGDDSDTAISDDTRRRLDLASEYYSMGVGANQDAHWDEAQFYLERALKILASLNIEGESDSTSSDTLPVESRRYNELLDNVVAAYHVTLLALGTLPPDVSPSALVEKYGDVEKRIVDSIVDLGSAPDTSVTYDIPIVLNERVNAAIRYFQTDARGAFERYFSRSTRYLPLIREIIRSYGLPEDLCYLPLVESGYNAHALSWAKALGLWQFIHSTGKIYGLNRSFWHDDRRDPVKATHAACQYLRDLYAKFDSWELALAAYNGGPGRVERTMAKERVSDFWRLRTLRKETRNYVPLFMAATIICKNPQRYGFNPDEIKFESPLAFEEVAVGKCLDFSSVADALKVSADEIAFLNPELLRRQTPPSGQYQLKIPAGAKEIFLAAYPELEEKATSLVYHTVKRGESLKGIASKYGVSTGAIKSANNLRNSRVKSGKTLLIPTGEDNSFADEPTPSGPKSTKNGVYLVRRGDTLYEIALAFAVESDDIRRLNGMGKKSGIYVGQRLRIPRQGGEIDTSSGYAKTSAENSDSAGARAGNNSTALTHTVRRGESLTAIARKYDVSIAEILDWNSLAANTTILPRQRLTIHSRNAKKTLSSRPATYSVRRGDNLAGISRRFNVAVSELREWNDLGRSSRILRGQSLRLRPPKSDWSSAMWHIVRPGETLASIAAQYDTTIDVLASMNSISDPGRIRIGDRLKIVK